MPDFTVRRSAKAKSIRLKVTPQDGLVVTLPVGFDEDALPEILGKKKSWIKDALAKADETRKFLEPRPNNHLPEQLDLKSLGEQWHVEYVEKATANGLSVSPANPDLRLLGREFPRENVMEKRKGWLRTRVQGDLVPRLKHIAERRRLTLNRVLVKNQRTRWASCSASKNISLNVKLLFLPAELVRYVMIHELCHTVHMNHSKDFWRFVESHDGNFRDHDDRLRDSWKLVPEWMYLFEERPNLPF